MFYLLDLGACKGKPSPKTLTQLAQWHNGTLCCPTRLLWWLLPRGYTNSRKHLCTVSKPDLFMPNFLVCLDLSSVISLCNKIQFVLWACSGWKWQTLVLISERKLWEPGLPHSFQEQWPSVPILSSVTQLMTASCNSCVKHRAQSCKIVIISGRCCVRQGAQHFLESD